MEAVHKSGLEKIADHGWSAAYPNILAVCGFLCALQRINRAAARKWNVGLLVRSDSSVAQLHEALQVAFGWEDDHLNRFVIRGREYAVYRDGGG